MAKRKRTSQTAHDNKVRKLKRDLESDGWRVKADVPGAEKPEPIGKHRRVPDIEATKSGHTRLIEVETSDSMGRDQDQRSTFRRSAAQRTNTTFRTEPAD